MARIPEETIARIRDAADILDVVSGYVQLKRRGRNHFGLCPFHQEKTPSFSVNQQKQIFHCFGCGRGGNALSFIMELEKVTFVEAVQRLGERVGIPVELSGPGEDPRKKATVQQVLDLYELATGHYRQNLQGDAGASVRTYLQERGIAAATQDLFKIGYALPGWDHLLKAVGSRKFTREAHKQSGLFGEGDRGPYDRFRSRIMFPISNISGRTVAFAGRVFESEDDAKYINSPETPVYHKGELLYGLALTRDAIREHDQAIIVEGYLDLIQLHQAGVKHVVAVSGTALTDRQARELRKLTTHVVLAYDGDPAGIQAAIRGGYTLLRNGLSPRVAELPADLDPDDWIRADGPEPFLEAVTTAAPLLNFHLSHFQGDLRQPGDLRLFLDESLLELAQVNDPLVREIHVKTVGELTGVGERALYQALQRAPRLRAAREEQAASHPPEGSDVLVEPTRAHRAQMALVRLAFEEDDGLLNLLLERAAEDLFTHPLLLSIWQAVTAALRQGKVPQPGTLIDQLETEEQRRLLSQVLVAAEQPASEETFSPSDRMSLAIDCLTTLQGEDLTRRIEQRRRDLREAEQETGQAIAEILGEVTSLQKELANLGRQFDEFRVG